jgi:1-deoxy-D-xylulose-5-phosphate synthase
MVREALEAADRLSRGGIDARVLNCRFMKPYDRDMLLDVLREHRFILTVEEGAVANGFGAYLGRELQEIPEAEGVRLRSMGIPDRFVAHGSRTDLLRGIDLDAQGIAERARRLLGSRPMSSDSPESSSVSRETA